MVWVLMGVRVMDVGSQGINGISLCQDMTFNRSTTLVIILTLSSWIFSAHSKLFTDDMFLLIDL